MKTYESMTPERLAEIRARVEKRTPGTWQWSDCDELIAQDGDDFASVIYGSISWPEDRDLIANAPQDLADLLAEVERLRARLTVDDDMVERAETVHRETLEAWPVKRSLEDTRGLRVVAMRTALDAALNTGEGS